MSLAKQQKPPKKTKKPTALTARLAAPEIVVQGQDVTMVTPEGKQLTMPLADFMKFAMPMARSTQGVVPAGVRMVDSRGPITLMAYEIPPCVRKLKWIAKKSGTPFGRGTNYRSVRIALPYVIVLAAFENDTLTDYNECFFRTAPLEDETDTLFFPALLNCSRFKPPEGKPLAWICTQKLDRALIKAETSPRRRVRVGLTCLVKCLFEAGFNYSSEHHEYSSWFTESKTVDPRIADIEKWQQATEKDPLFVLDIPWLPTKMTLREVFDRVFANQNAAPAGSGAGLKTSRDLARIITNHTK